MVCVIYEDHLSVLYYASGIEFCDYGDFLSLPVELVDASNADVLSFLRRGGQH